MARPVMTRPGPGTVVVVMGMMGVGVRVGIEVKLLVFFVMPVFAVTVHVHWADCEWLDAD